LGRGRTLPNHGREKIFKRKRRDVGRERANKQLELETWGSALQSQGEESLQKPSAGKGPG